MTIERRRQMTFEETADLYDEVRPGYPEKLIDDVIEMSGITPSGRILEIGCGPGNATLPFARRGYRILAIELGERLAAFAAAHLRPYPNATVVNSSFEDWDVEESAFDLAISADAFHWIPPEVGYPKIARALRPSGAATLFWFVAVDPHTEWSTMIDDVYHAEAPGLLESTTISADWLASMITRQFAESRCFGDVTIRQYSWSLRFTAEQYVKLARTWSRHRGLDEPTRARLFAGFRNVIERFGGTVDVPHAVVLFHAHVSR